MSRDTSTCPVYGYLDRDDDYLSRPPGLEVYGVFRSIRDLREGVTMKSKGVMVGGRFSVVCKNVLDKIHVSSLDDTEYFPSRSGNTRVTSESSRGLYLDPLYQG